MRPRTLVAARIAADEGPPFAVHGVEHGGAVVAFPLILEDRTLGSLGFCFPESRAFDGDDHAFILSIAQQCALAVERVRWHEVAEQEIARRRASEERKDEFLAMLAHELRNPLAPIFNAVQLLGTVSPETPTLERARTMIERQVTHMARLVDDLLDISRISRGKITLCTERLDLVELARTTALDYKALLDARRLHLELSLPPRPVWLRADATRLAQAMGNLLQNAGKFTDGGGTVRLSVAPDPQHGAVVVEVADTGIGMEPSVLTQIFEPFAQADVSLERSRGGLGLGLALVKGVVELHGGSVRAASAGLGHGSTISITLPMESAAEGATEAPSPVSAVSSVRSSGSRRILIIEDNVDAAESLSMLLELSGHSVTMVHNGADGVAAARLAPPDVIICDIGLPGGLDGYAVARALRANSAMAQTVSIALTGYGQDEERKRARASGFDAHLTKPVAPATLERLIADLAARPGTA